MDGPTRPRPTARGVAVRRRALPTGFREHVIVFVAVNAVLLVVWSATSEPGSDGSPWPVWVLGLWSLVLAAHALLARTRG